MKLFFFVTLAARILALGLLISLYILASPVCEKPAGSTQRYKFLQKSFKASGGGYGYF